MAQLLWVRFAATNGDEDFARKGRDFERNWNSSGKTQQ
jgi:hypothetical protein